MYFYISENNLTGIKREDFDSDAWLMLYEMDLRNNDPFDCSTLINIPDHVQKIYTDCPLLTSESYLHTSKRLSTTYIQTSESIIDSTTLEVEFYTNRTLDVNTSMFDTTQSTVGLLTTESVSGKNSLHIGIMVAIAIGVSILTSIIVFCLISVWLKKQRDAASNRLQRICNFEDELSEI